MTKCGRIFGIAWTLYGLIITTLIIGNLTAGLLVSVSYTTTETELYQAHVRKLIVEQKRSLTHTRLSCVFSNTPYLFVLHVIETFLNIAVTRFRREKIEYLVTVNKL